MESIYLETSHYILRPISVADLPALVELDSDPEVMLFINNGQPTSLEWWRDEALPTIQQYYQRYDHKLGNWIITNKADGEFLGWFHLRPDKEDLNNTKILELGYRLKQSAWGKGIASDVSKTLIAKAFLELEAEEVFARSLKDNIASIKVMMKSGLTFDKDFLYRGFPGGDKEAVRYSVSLCHWKERTGQ